MADKKLERFRHERPFACEECRGSGTMECPCCDNETTCDMCDGTGLNADKMDVKAFKAADDLLFKDEKRSWEWVDRQGVWLGRAYPSGKRLAYADFELGRIPRVERADQPSLFGETTCQ